MLIHKRQLEACKLAEPVLAGELANVLLDEDGTLVCTNGYSMIWSKADEEVRPFDFPQIKGQSIKPLSGPIVLEVEPFLQMGKLHGKRKVMLPVLEYVAVVEGPSLVSTDLEVEFVLPCKKVEYARLEHTSKGRWRDLFGRGLLSNEGSKGHAEFDPREVAKVWAILKSLLAYQPGRGLDGIKIDLVPKGPDCCMMVFGGKAQEFEFGGAIMGMGKGNPK